jgi:hypothetical protein
MPATADIRMKGIRTMLHQTTAAALDLPMPFALKLFFLRRWFRPAYRPARPFRRRVMRRAMRRW